MESAKLRLCKIILSNKMEDHVRVRLIHMHYYMKESEVPVLRPIMVEDICAAVVMSPMPSNTLGLAGKHYLFDEFKDSFVAYEHSTVHSFDLLECTTFLEQYKDELVLSPGASLIFGLGIRDQDVKMQEKRYCELELPILRGTVAVPFSMIPLAIDETNFHRLGYQDRGVIRNTNGMHKCQG